MNSGLMVCCLSPNTQNSLKNKDDVASELNEDILDYRLANLSNRVL